VKPDFSQLQKSWLSLMATTNAPVREKMALFWHQRLAVSGRQLGGSSLRWIREYRDLLRAHGLGSWRTLLKELTRNGAMLVWLTGLPSDKAHPNENYAREFWELFTLGVDVRYTQADIQEAARAYTGWDSRWDEVTELESLYFNPEAHDEGAILGGPGWRGTTSSTSPQDPEAAFLARIFEGRLPRRPGRRRNRQLTRRRVGDQAPHADGRPVAGVLPRPQVRCRSVVNGRDRGPQASVQARPLCSAEVMGQVPSTHWREGLRAGPQMVR
jgi:hypothetical protein